MIRRARESWNPLGTKGIDEELDDELLFPVSSMRNRLFDEDACDSEALLDILERMLVR